MRYIRGFTLIELMVTVLILAILAAIAIPAYTDYVIRGKLPEGQSQLSSFNVQMEQYYQDNRNYGTAGGACGVTPPTSKYFTYSCLVDATGQKYTATAKSAVNVGLGAADSYIFTIDESNSKSTTAFTGTTVSSSAPAACWMLSKSGC